MARDYGKPGMNTTDLNVQHQLEPPKVRSAWIRSEFPEGDRVEILVEAEFAKSLHEMYGAPATAWINYTVGSAITKSITLEISLLNKTATRCKSYWVTSWLLPSFDCYCHWLCYVDIGLSLGQCQRRCF